ncbi:MAG: PXPV repeat protein [Pseudomonadota bacterium]
MNRLFSAKSLAMATVVLGGVAAATAAQARSDVVLSIGVNAPYGYVQPAPVYVAPQPVYVQPQTVYYGQPRYYVQRNGAYGDWDHDGVPNRFDRDSRFYDPRVAHRRHGGWDRDRDGVANRYDRAPNNPYRY